jgi:glycerate-2-kinase
MKRKTAPIRDKEVLIDNGTSKHNKKARRIALDVFEKVLAEADPKVAMRGSLRIDSNELLVKENRFELGMFENIYVIGGGKAGGGMAEAIEETLGDKISCGFVNIPEGSKERYDTRQIELNESSHPVPNERGVEGSKQILEIGENAKVSDIMIVLISGGASSLMPLPAGDLVLSDIQELTEALLRSGAVIAEVNAVRKHLSNIKGGRLASACYPATVVSLIISDVVGDPLDIIASGPTVPDPSTFQDAVNVLNKYELLDRFPKIKQHLEKGLEGSFPETLKQNDKVFDRVYNFLISTNEIVMEKVVKEISERYDSTILTSRLEGEAREVGKRMQSLATSEKKARDPKSRPKVILAGGETTVSVKGDGKGGRNQELVLSAMEGLIGDGIVIASIGTDGIDGASDAAGAIADGKNHSRAVELGLNPEKFLDINDSYNLHKKLNDLIITGPTGTNINDIAIIVIV